MSTAIVMKEKWKSIPTFNGLYEASSFGRIKSFWFGKENILSNCISSTGYYVVNLSDGNSIKTDNRVCNLRVVSQRVNCNNGEFTGTTFDKNKGKWMSQAGIKYKHIFLGYYENRIDAAKAYKDYIIKAGLE